ncbi:MAG: hypothetical protein KJZ84_04560 [Bryobacteraceae bacterium]|nr:hypothetical protein [Bryobacteraceae bacterium]
MTGAACYNREVRLRSAAAYASLALFVVTSVGFFARKAANEVRTVTLWAPRSVVPPDVRKQIAVIRSKIPCGAPLVYVDPKIDQWVFGVWKRTFHPVNNLVSAVGEAELAAVRRQYGMKYALIVGDAPDWVRFEPLAALGGYPGTAPVVLGALE